MTFRGAIDAPSPNFNDRPGGVDSLVLHYTNMVDGPSALSRLVDVEAGVSAHYLVEEDGRVFALVPEEKRAWHTGRSIWRGASDLNSRSIGVEIVNGGHAYGLPPYPDVQISAVIALARDVLSRWRIPPTGVLGHSDIAPDRKEDPGEHFPWRRLAEAGVGLWPEDDPIIAGDPEDVARDLAEIGYGMPEFADDPAGAQALASVLRAFQRRWRPELVSGEADGQTRRRVAAVADLYRRHRAALGGDHDIMV